MKASIWFYENVNIDALNAMSKDTMAEWLKIIFQKADHNTLVATMPVVPASHQPYGLLHGGASAALAETIGSVASLLCINPEKQMCVGMELNCNHIRGKKEGIVTATAAALHIGATSHVWDIRITDEREKLICVSRLTVAILKNRQLDKG